MSRTSAAILRAILLGTSCLSAIGLSPVRAQPTGGQVALGAATITNPNASTTIIDQKTGKAVINWNSFSIGAGGTVQFNQPNGQAIALNRVLGGEASSFYGKLLANGQVWIINQNGILFGKGATFNVGGILATTADISNTDFAAGDYRFSGGTGASVVNQGTIRARNGGVVLSGAGVSNEGLIEANAGTVILGGASAFTVDFVGDGLIKYAITQPAGKADNGRTGVSNSGTINAPGGRVVMTARAAANVQDAVVNNTGMISATSAKLQDGEVVLDAGDGDVADSGTIDASGAGRGQTGGFVSITGHNVTVADNTRIDVSGDSGGGSVRIGGDVHGEGTLPTAANTHVGRATITADATRTGNGGSLVVWSNGLTDFSGIFSAKGGTLSGNGGFLETSGHQLNVTHDATVDTTAPEGHVGTWLLDPTNIDIETGGPDTDLSTGSHIDPATITAALSHTDVQLVADNDITVHDAITYTDTRAAGLSLEAGASININAAISSSTSTLGLTLDANRAGAGGYVDITAAITTNGGNLIIGGGAVPSSTAAVGTAGHTVGVYIGDVLSTSGGNITINGTGYQGADTGSNEYGVYVHAAIDAGTGDISITGSGGNSTGSSNFGILQDANIAGGDISLTTTAGGAMILGGDLTAAGHTVTLNSSGTVSQNAGAITADTVQGGSTGGFTLGGSSNAFANLGPVTNTGAGGVTVVDSSSLSAGTIDAGTGSLSLTAAGFSGGSLTAGQDISITSTGGGVLSITGDLTATAGDVTLATTGGGDIALGGDVTTSAASHTVALNSSGTVTQSAGAITTGTVQGTSAGGFTLGSSSNAFDNLGPVTNTGAGGVTVVDSFSLSVGTISGGTGSISLTGAGLSFTSLTAAQDLSLDAGSGTLSGTGATATAGTLTLSGGTISLSGTASAGTDLFATASSGGASFDSVSGGRDVILSAALDNLDITTSVTTGRDYSVTAQDFLEVSLAPSGGVTRDYTIVDTSGGFSTAALTAGRNLSITSTNGGALYTTGALTAAAGDVTLTTTGGGNIALGGDVTTSAAGHTVALNSSGTINQTGGIITAGTLTGSSVGGATLNGANLVDHLGAFSNTVSGTFSFTDNQGFSTTGTISNGGAGDINLTTTGGGITVGQAVSNLGTGGIVLDAAGYVDVEAAITTQGGALVIGGGADPSTDAAQGTASHAVGVYVGGALSTNGGDITIHGTGYQGTDTGSNEYGVYVHAAIDAGTGDISITGTGGNSTGFANYGIFQDASIAGHNITLLGTGGGTAGDEEGVVSLSEVTSDSGAISVTGVAAAPSGNAANTGITLYGATITTGGSGTITLAGTAKGSGSGPNAYGIYAANNSVVSVENGTLSATGTNFSTGTGGQNMGLRLDGASFESTGAGDITLVGSAGGTGGGIAQLVKDIGVYIDFSHAVQSLGTGAITITGTGGDTSGLGDQNFGVYIPGEIASHGGAISVTGTGGGVSVGNKNAGIYQTGTISNTGTGSITLVGTGGGVSTLAYGYYNTGGSVTTDTGNISITGSASVAAVGNQSDGVHLDTFSVITTGGSGTITLAGTAEGTGSNSAGVRLQGAAVTAADGLITVTGTNNSAGIGTGNVGVLVAAGWLKTTGAGDLSVTGFGGGAFSDSQGYGVQLAANNGIQATGSGGITIAGTGGGGGGTGSDNIGVYLGAALSANGGAISITGTGGNSSGTNDSGIYQGATISNTGTGGITLSGTGGGTGSSEGYTGAGDITAATGNISIIGNAGASATGSGSNGIEFTAGTISTGGNGTITISGTARGDGSGSGTNGVYFNGLAVSVTAVDGLISVTGHNNSTGTGVGNDGIYLAHGTVASSGTGGVTMLGFGGGAGAGGADYGVRIDPANGVQSTNSGAITITGTGGDSGGTGDGNIGVYLAGALAGHGGAVSLTGTGGNASGANEIGIQQSAAVSNTGTGSISLNGTGGISVDGGISTPGAVSLTSTGNIIATGAGSVAGSRLMLDATGDVTLQNASNAFGTLTITSAANATLSDAGDVEIDGGTVTGALALTGTGAISQGGTGSDAITAGTLNLSAAGAIALANHGNSFGALHIGGGTGATLYDTSAVEIDGVTVTGTLVLTDTHAISQGGTAGDAISAAVLNVSTPDAITLGNTANAFGKLTIANAASATLYDLGGVEIDGASVSGTLALTDTGAITQGGTAGDAISAGTLNVSTSGAIMLGNTSNVFGKLIIGGASGATLYDAHDVEIDGATVTGTLALTSTGAITQGGALGDAISAGTLNVTASGTITLGNTANALDKLTVGGATSATLYDLGGLEIDGVLVSGTLAVTDTGAITQGGTAGDAINAGTLNVSTSGAITLGNTANTFGTLIIGNASGATIYDAHDVEIDGANLTGTLALTSTGAITQGGTAGDAISAGTLNVTASGTITLGNTANAFDKLVIGGATSATLYDLGGVEIDGALVSGTLTLTNIGAITQGGTAGDAISAGTLNVSTSGAITLGNTANAFDTLVVGNASSATLYDLGGVEIDGALVSGTLTLTDTGAITQGGTASDAIHVGTLNLSTSGAITLGNTANAFDKLIIGGAAGATLYDANSVEIDGATVTGTLVLTSTGAVSQGASLGDAIDAGTLNVSASGAITLGNTSNAFSALNIGGASNATIYDTSNVEIDGATVTGTLALTDAAAISQGSNPGDVISAGTLNVSASGAITLGNVGNTFGTLTIGNASSATVVDAANMQIDGATVAGTLALTGAGTVSQGAAIHAGVLSISTPGVVTLGNTANTFGTLIIGNASSASLYDASDVEIDGATVIGTLALTSAGAITQGVTAGDAISAATLNVSAGGTITLGNHANVFPMLTIGGGSSATIYDASNVTINGATVAGVLALTGTGTIGQGGSAADTINAGTLNVWAAGAITLGNVANVFGTLVIGGASSATLNDTGNVEIDGATVTGTLALTTTGAITQGGTAGDAISAGTLRVSTTDAITLGNAHNAFSVLTIVNGSSATIADASDMEVDGVTVLGTLALTEGGAINQGGTAADAINAAVLNVSTSGAISLGNTANVFGKLIIGAASGATLYDNSSVEIDGATVTGALALTGTGAISQGGALGDAIAAGTLNLSTPGTITLGNISNVFGKLIIGEASGTTLYDNSNVEIDGASVAGTLALTSAGAISQGGTPGAAISVGTLNLSTPGAITLGNTSNVFGKLIIGAASGAMLYDSSSVEIDGAAVTGGLALTATGAISQGSTAGDAISAGALNLSTSGTITLGNTANTFDKLIIGGASGATLYDTSSVEIDGVTVTGTLALSGGGTISQGGVPGDAINAAVLNVSATGTITLGNASNVFGTLIIGSASGATLHDGSSVEIDGATVSGTLTLTSTGTISEGSAVGDAINAGTLNVSTPGTITLGNTANTFGKLIIGGASGATLYDNSNVEIDGASVSGTLVLSSSGRISQGGTAGDAIGAGTLNVTASSTITLGNTANAFDKLIVGGATSATVYDLGGVEIDGATVTGTLTLTDTGAITQGGAPGDAISAGTINVSTPGAITLDNTANTFGKLIIGGASDATLYDNSDVEIDGAAVTDLLALTSTGAITQGGTLGDAISAGTLNVTASGSITLGNTHNAFATLTIGHASSATLYDVGGVEIDGATVTGALALTDTGAITQGRTAGDAISAGTLNVSAPGAVTLGNTSNTFTKLVIGNASGAALYDAHDVEIDGATVTGALALTGTGAITQGGTAGDAISAGTLNVSTLGVITLGNTSNVFSKLTIGAATGATLYDNSDVEIDGAAVTGFLALTGTGAIIQGGTAADAISAGTLNLSTSGTITLGNTSNVVGKLTIGGASGTTLYDNSDVEIDGAAVTGLLALTSTGAITQGAATGDAISAGTLNVSATGAVTLGNTHNTFATLTIGHASSAALYDTNTFEIDGATVAGTLALTNGGAINQGVTAGDAVHAGRLNVSAVGAITLANPGNAFGVLTIAGGTSAFVADTGDVEIDGVSLTGTLVLRSTGAISQGGTTGDAIVASALDVATGSGAIALDNVGNAFGTLTVLTHNADDATFVDSTGVTIASAAVGGSLILAVGGPVSQTGAVHAAALDVSTSSGAIVLQNVGNVFGTLTVLTHGTDGATITDSTGVAVAAATVGGTFTLGATGPVSQTGAIHAATLNVSSGGTITLNDAGNAFGRLTIGAGTIASLHDTGDVEVDGVSVTGALILTAAGNISQGGAATDAISAPVLNVSAGGSITLLNHANTFASLTVGGGTDAMLYDARGVEVDGASVSGTLVLTSGGAISQGGAAGDAILVSALNVATNSGAITLTNAANAFGTLTILTHGLDGVSLTDSGALNVASAVVGGTLNLAAGGPIGQSGVVHATALDIATSSGEIDLENNGNVFGTLAVHTPGTATLVDSAGVVVAGASVGGRFTLAAGGGITQTGFIHAGALDVTAAGAITLADYGNTFGTLTVGGATNATLYDAADVEVDGATVTGTFALTGSGAISQGTGASDAITAHILNASATRTIGLGNVRNAFDVLTIGSGSNASLYDTGNVEVDGVSLSGKMALTATGAISQGATAGDAIVVSALDIATGGGSITLDNASNVFGTLTASASGNGTFVDSTGMTVSGAAAGGTLTLVASGAIGQTGAIHAAVLDVSTSSGAIVLANSSNVFSTLSVHTHSADSATFADSTGVTISGATVGGIFTLSSGGTITQTGAIQAAALNLSASGAITLLDHGNSFNFLTIGSAPVASLYGATDFEIDGLTVGGTVMLTGAGAISQGSGAGNAISASTLVVSGGGAITLLNHTNAFGKLTIGGGTGAALYDVAGVEIDGVSLTGTFALTSAGAISQGGSASDAVGVAALDLSAGGAITLGHAGNVFGTLTVLTQGADSATFKNSTGVTVTGATVGGTFTLAAGGAITQSGAIQAAALDVSTGSGAITLTNAANAFGTLTALTHGSDNATFTDSTGVTVAHAAAGGVLTLAAGESVTQSGAIAAATLNVSTSSGAVTLTSASNAFGNLFVLTHGSDAATFVDTTGVTVTGATVGGQFILAAGGAVTQSGGIQSAGLDVSTGSGPISLTNAGNVFGSLHLLTHGADNASLVDSTGVTITGATVGGTLTLAAGGPVTQSGAIRVLALDVSTSSGAVTLTDTGNAFGTLTVLTHGSDDATITDSTGLSIVSAMVGGMLRVASGGPVAQTGAVHATGLDVSTSTGSITLTNGSNVFSTLALLTHGADNATITDTTGVTINGATIGGTLTLATGGAIAQTGAINAPVLNISTSTGAMTLNNAGNVFGTLTLLTHGADNATLTDSTGVTIASATVGGTLTLAAGGAVTQIGAINAAALDISTSTGAVTLANTGNVFSTLTLLTHGSDNATVVNSTGVSIASAAVGGTLKLLTGGAVTQTGAIHAAALDVSTSSGAITLTNASNAFGTLTLLTHGSDSATLTDSTGVSIASAAVSGTFRVAAGGAVTQTGAIQAAALDVSTAAGSIVLTNASNVFGTLTLLTRGTDGATITDSTGVSVAGAAVGGTLSLSTGGAISQTGAIRAAALNVSTVTGAVTLTNASNAFGTLTVLTHGADNATLADSADVTVTAATVGGDLTLLSAGSIGVVTTVQSTTGAIILVAGWDGHTLAPAQFGNAGVFGNNGKGVTIGGAGATENSSLGSATGTTSIYGANLNVAAVHGYAQVGTHGHGSGSVLVNVTGNVSVAGGTGTGQFAQIGNGGLGASGNNSGDITIVAGGDLILAGGAGTEAYAQIGHGGAESNVGSSGYSNTGAITISAVNLLLNAGAGNGSYVQIGEGGFRAGNNLRGGTVTNVGTITVNASGTVSLNGGGADAYAQIGNGGDQVNENASPSAGGTEGGNVVVTALGAGADAITVTGGTGANAYVQIGNGGYAANRGTGVKAANFTMTGDVTVSDLKLVGGSGADNAYALIGNGDVARMAIGDVGGNITVNAGSITVTPGTALHSGVGVGHYTGGGTSTGRTSGLPTDSPSGQGVLAEDANGTKRAASKTTGIGPQSSGGGSGDNTPGSTVASFGGVIAGDGSFASLSDSAAVFIADSLSGQRNSSVRLLMAGLLVQIVPTNAGRGIYAVPPADQDFSSWGNDALWQ